MKLRKTDPALHPFPGSTTLMDSVSISSYRDVQMLAGNTRYSRKEHRKGMMCVAVKIENHSHHTITLTPEHFHVYQNATRLEFVTPENYVKKVKQHRGWYALHILWGPVALVATKTAFLGDDPLSNVLSLGCIAGYLVCGFNVNRAGHANHDNLGFLRQYQIIERTIQPGETVYGLVVVKNPPPGALRFVCE